MRVDLKKLYIMKLDISIIGKTKRDLKDKSNFHISMILQIQKKCQSEVSPTFSRPITAVHPQDFITADIT